MWSSKHDTSADWWHALTDVRDNAAERAHDVSGRARDKFDEASTEAQRRAMRAWAALAGRPAPRPWLPIAIAAAAGVAIGWLGAMAYRRRPEIEQALHTASHRVQEATAEIGERVDAARTTPGGPVAKAKAGLADRGDDGAV